MTPANEHSHANVIKDANQLFNGGRTRVAAIADAIGALGASTLNRTFDLGTVELVSVAPHTTASAAPVNTVLACEVIDQDTSASQLAERGQANVGITMQVHSNLDSIGILATFEATASYRPAAPRAGWR